MANSTESPLNLHFAVWFFSLNAMAADKKKQTAALKKANQALAAQFKVEGYPTLILLDGEGKKLGEVDYDGEGPKALLAAIEKYLGK